MPPINATYSRLCGVCFLFVWSVLSLTLTAVHTQELAAENENKIYFILMLPFPQDTTTQDPSSFEANSSSPSPRLLSETATYDDGHDIAPAAYLAVQQINERSDILKGYTLDLIRSDGGCNIIERTAVGFARGIIHRNESVLGIVGPSCSDSSTTIAQLTSYDAVSLISVHYGALATLGDRTIHPHTFGVLGSTSLWVGAYVELIRYNSWTNVAVLFTDTSADLLEWKIGLQKAIGTLEGYTSFAFQVYDTFFPLQELKDNFIRIIFVLLTPELSQRLLCLAYHEGIRFPNYQFVFSDRLDSDFGEIRFIYDGTRYYCSNEDIQTALKGNLNFFLSFNTEPLNSITDTGLSYEEFLVKYEQMVLWYEERFQVNSTTTYWANPAYDAVWALSFALNDSLSELEARNLSILESKLGKRKEITDVIESNMIHVNFSGVSGRINFDESNGFTNRTLNLFQYDSNQTGLKIGYYESGEFTLLSEPPSNFISSGFAERAKRLPLGVAIFLLVFTTGILLVALPAHTINIAFRKRRSIKATSPRLNNLVFIGGYSTVIGVVLLVVAESIELSLVVQTKLCNAVPFFLSIGLTLLLGTVCFKTWRLYHIFVKWKKVINTSQWLLRDNTLIVFVILLTVFDLILCILWVTIDPRKPGSDTTIETVPNEPLPIAVTDSYCHSVNSVWWLSAIIVHKAVIMGFSVFFAYSTRKVFNTDFQTRNITMLVYMFSLLLGVGFPVYAIIRAVHADESAQFIVLCTFMDVAVYMSLFVLFLPPIIPLCKNKLKSSQYTM